MADILQHTSYNEEHPYPIEQEYQPKWKPESKSQNKYTKVIGRKRTKVMLEV